MWAGTSFHLAATRPANRHPPGQPRRAEPIGTQRIDRSARRPRPDEAGRSTPRQTSHNLAGRPAPARPTQAWPASRHAADQRRYAKSIETQHVDRFGGTATPADIRRSAHDRPGNRNAPCQPKIRRPIDIRRSAKCAKSIKTRRVIGSAGRPWSVDTHRPTQDWPASHIRQTSQDWPIGQSWPTSAWSAWVRQPIEPSRGRFGRAAQARPAWMRPVGPGLAALSTCASSGASAARRCGCGVSAEVWCSGRGSASRLGLAVQVRPGWAAAG